MDDQLKLKLQRVVDPVRPVGFKLFVFGSRARGDNRKYSDIDLGIVGKGAMPAGKYFAIEQALSDSDLPYRVDVVDFANVSEKFRNKAMERTIEI